MDWEDRIRFSMMLIEEASKILSDKDIILDGDPASRELEAHAIALRQYLADSDLQGADDSQRKMESVCIFKDAIETVFPKIFSLNEQSKNVVPEYMTFEEATEKLISQYNEEIETGGSEVAGLTMGEWLQANGIEIVDENERLSMEKMSMRDSMDDPVNSRAVF